jgi:S1-C subfamily serine protease
VMQRSKITSKVRQTKPCSELPNFVTLVKRYKKAVLGIEVIQGRSQNRGFTFGMPWERHDIPSYRSVNIGTGFVFHPKGYILTNEHVVSGASKVMVRLFGKKDPVVAHIVGSDPKHDVAVLRANIVIPHPVLKLGKTKDVQVGEWVVAIGSPLGLDNTVTVGIISAKDRPMQIGEREYPSLLQTDAAINRGNSGGPLINLRGEVIGMNTAVSQSSQGIGFAIAADVLRQTLQEIIK